MVERGGGALVHIRLNPSDYKNTLKNKRLFGQSQSPGARGSSVCLPRLSPPFIPGRFFFFGFFVRASTLPCSFGQDLKRDPGGSDSQPFPTRGIHAGTTANCLDYDNSAWRRKKERERRGTKKMKEKKSQTISQPKASGKAKKQPPASKYAERGSNLLIIQVTL